MKNICFLFLVILAVSSSNDDLERKVEGLENEIQKVISANDLLSLKHELYLACYEGKLLKEVEKNETGDMFCW